LAGNAQVVAIAGFKDGLKADADHWRTLGQRLAARREQWQLAQRLVHHAATLARGADAAAALQAIEGSRSLLDDPDPVAPVVASLTDALRAALGDRLAAFVQAREHALAELAQSASWSALDERKRAEILGAVGLANHQAPAIGTTSELIATLEAWPIAEWDVRADAVARQAARAHELAARVGDRDAVVVTAPHGVIHDKVELDAYLDELRGTIAGHLDAGDSVVI
jgi:hypothetical protein